MNKMKNEKFKMEKIKKKLNCIIINALTASYRVWFKKLSINDYVISMSVKKSKKYDENSTNDRDNHNIIYLLYYL